MLNSLVFECTVDGHYPMMQCTNKTEELFEAGDKLKQFVVQIQEENTFVLKWALFYIKFSTLISRGNLNLC